MRGSLRWAGAAVLGTLTLMAAPAATWAGFMVRLTDTTTASVPITVTDGGLLDLDATANNQIRYVGTAGDLDVNSSVSITNSPGSPDIASVGVASGVVTNLSPAAR